MLKNSSQISLDVWSEFTLPKNSKIDNKAGKTFKVKGSDKSPSRKLTGKKNPKNIRIFEVYRYDPEDIDKKNPHIDKFEIDINILDLATGTGRIAGFVKNSLNSASVMGIDNSKKSLHNLARQQVESNLIEIKIRDAYRLKTGAKFDLIIDDVKNVNPLSTLYLNKESPPEADISILPLL